MADMIGTFDRDEAVAKPDDEPNAITIITDVDTTTNAYK